MLFGDFQVCCEFCRYNCSYNIFRVTFDSYNDGISNKAKPEVLPTKTQTN